MDGMVTVPLAGEEEERRRRRHKWVIVR